MSKRVKIILGIVGIVVVVAVAVVAYIQVAEVELFGASIIGISPSNPSIQAGQTVTLSASTSLRNCSWSSGNTAVATVASNNKSAGQANIHVKCGAGVSTGNTTVTVNRVAKQMISPRITTASFNISAPLPVLSTGDATTVWKLTCTNSGAYLQSGGTLGDTVGPVASVSFGPGVPPGTCTITANSSKYTDKFDHYHPVGTTPSTRLMFVVML